MSFRRALSTDMRCLVAVAVLASGVALSAAAPVVTSVTPNSGLAGGGTPVTISGSGFTGATAVSFGGAPATSVVVVNDTTITATTPARNPGPVEVFVTTAEGTGVLVDGFLYGNVPFAAADSYTTPASTPLEVAAPGILSNDSSVLSGSVTALLESTVTNGVLVFNADGSFKYTPNAGFFGSDTFTYRAVNSAGAGNRAIVTIAIATPTTAQPPLNVVVSAVSGNLVTLKWTNNPAGLTPTAHVIEGGVNPGEVLGAVAVSAAPIATFTAPTGAFYFRVRAVADGATSGPSNEVRAFVNLPIVPSAPENLLSVVNGSTLGLAWRNGYAGGEPSSLVLDVTGGITTSIPLGLTDNFNVAGVPAGTYTLALRAVNTSGSSLPSAPVTVTFPGACSGAPSAPVNFVAYKVGATIHVIWDPPTSGPAPTSYLLDVTGAFVGAIPTTSRTLNGMVGPGSYGLRVSAVNACGSSAPTAEQTVTIP